MKLRDTLGPVILASLISTQSLAVSKVLSCEEDLTRGRSGGAVVQEGMKTLEIDCVNAVPTPDTRSEEAIGFSTSCEATIRENSQETTDFSRSGETFITKTKKNFTATKELLLTIEPIQECQGSYDGAFCVDRPELGFVYNFDSIAEISTNKTRSDQDRRINYPSFSSSSIGYAGFRLKAYSLFQQIETTNAGTERNARLAQGGESFFEVVDSSVGGLGNAFMTFRGARQKCQFHR